MVAGGYATRGTVTCADARRLGVTPRWSSALAQAVHKTNQQTALPGTGSTISTVYNTASAAQAERNGFLIRRGSRVVLLICDLT